MDISFAESIIYAFVSAIAEFMPISSLAHEQILLKLFGMQQIHPLMQLFVHGGMLFALIFSCKGALRHMNRENQLLKISVRRRKRQPDPQVVSDISFVKVACIPIVLGFLFFFSINKLENRLPLSAAMLAVNGLLLHIPIYFSTGNKDSRSMTRIDSFMFGVSSSVGIIPGLSRIGLAGSYASLRGADFNHTYKWCLLLSIPTLAMLLLCDIVQLFSASYAGFYFLFVLQCIFAAAVAFLGAMMIIRLMRFYISKNGMSVFSYYCWGAALFAFILYLYT